MSAASPTKSAKSAFVRIAGMLLGYCVPAAETVPFHVSRPGVISLEESFLFQLFPTNPGRSR